MKKFAIVLILIIVCSVPAFSATCRNGRMTVYHNDKYGYYPNNHVYNNDALKEPVKPVYSYRPVSVKQTSQVSQRPMPSMGYRTR